MLGHAPRFEYLQEFRSQAGFDLVGAHLDDHARRLHRAEEKKMPSRKRGTAFFSRCAAKTELCVTVESFSGLWFLSIPKSSRHTQHFLTLRSSRKNENTFALSTFLQNYSALES